MLIRFDRMYERDGHTDRHRTSGTTASRLQSIARQKCIRHYNGLDYSLMLQSYNLRISLCINADELKYIGLV